MMSEKPSAMTIELALCKGYSQNGKTMRSFSKRNSISHKLLLIEL